MGMINFNKGNSEEDHCPVCSIVEEYTQEIIQAEDMEELQEILHEMLELGVRQGRLDQLQLDIEIRQQMFNHFLHTDIDDDSEFEVEFADEEEDY